MRKLSIDTWFVLVIILFGLLIYIPYIESFDRYDCRQYYSGDSWWYMEMVRSMVKDGDLNMENNIPESLHISSGQLALSKDNYLAPKHGIFFPVATVPFYYLFGDSGFVIFNLCFTILILILLYLIIREFFNYIVSLSTTILYSVSTIILNYSYNYLSDVFSTVIILLAFCYQKT